MPIFFSAEPYNLDDPQWDFHVLTGALKLFFRELKEPLFPFDFYDKLKYAISKLLFIKVFSGLGYSKEHIHYLSVKSTALR
jgi:hypothetical protein